MLKKVAVIGYPVKHSLSPKLHGFWLEKYKDELQVKGVEGEYGMLEVVPEDLEKTLLGLKDNGYVGCNLTVPHKETGFEIVSRYGSVDDVAKLIGAVNTIYIRDRKLFGTNTDAYGFIENIKQSAQGFDFKNKRVVVLGAGGAARAIIYGFLNSGVKEIILTNRTENKAEELKNEFCQGGRQWYLPVPAIYENEEGVNTPSCLVANWDDRNEILKDINILVNTTSLGMTGQPDIDINLDKLPTSALVTDIVYKPLETTLLKNARNRGNKVVDGLGMLVHQARGGFKLWFDLDINPEDVEGAKKYLETLI